MYMKEKAIAIITARGGSKRIPKKNIREFCGKPIIAYSIEAALKSNLFDEVMAPSNNTMKCDIYEKDGKYNIDTDLAKAISIR